MILHCTAFVSWVLHCVPALVILRAKEIEGSFKTVLGAAGSSNTVTDSGVASKSVTLESRMALGKYSVVTLLPVDLCL